MNHFARVDAALKEEERLAVFRGGFCRCCRGGGWGRSRQAFFFPSFVVVAVLLLFLSLPQSSPNCTHEVTHQLLPTRCSSFVSFLVFLPFNKSGFQSDPPHWLLRGGRRGPDAAFSVTAALSCPPCWPLQHCHLFSLSQYTTQTHAVPLCNSSSPPTQYIYTLLLTHTQ